MSEIGHTNVIVITPEQMGKGMGVHRTLAVNILFNRDKERDLKQIWQNINFFLL